MGKQYVALKRPSPYIPQTASAQSSCELTDIAEFFKNVISRWLCREAILPQGQPLKYQATEHAY